MRFVRRDVRGPHHVLEKRPRTAVSALQSIAAAEQSKTHHFARFSVSFDTFSTASTPTTAIDLFQV